MTRHLMERRVLEAAEHDARKALTQDDGAWRWLLDPDANRHGPLAAEVWACDEALTHVLMVDHRWRGWVAPGGKVEPGETPREAAVRELFEETGVDAELLGVPAAAAVRSYRPGRPAVLGLSFTAVADRRVPLAPEDGQPAAWLRLDAPWQGWFAGDRLLKRRCADWIRERGTAPGVQF
ncbi:NUDIX domain-containing protein [Streptomyces sp. NPDC002309]